MDLDQQVDTGIEPRWIDAQKSAVSAKRDYIKKINEATERLKQKTT